MAVTLQRAESTSIDQRELALVQAADRTRYEIHDHTTVEMDEHSHGLLDIWSPMIPETPDQRVLDIEVTAPGP
jgi:hypothetical protein